jgi:EAL domain-containing protein (putative c-di-GMP-specific phosphodiesterase class I)
MASAPGTPRSTTCQFQFDSVKLDGTLAATIATDKVARSTAGALINVSHSMDVTAVAGGVETAQQLDDLRASVPTARMASIWATR